MTLLEHCQKLDALCKKVKQDEISAPMVWNRHFKGTLLDNRVKALAFYRNAGKLVTYKDGSREFL